MANNLHISYDLNSPGQNYSRVIEKIKSLGGSVKIHMSYWYLSTNLTAQQVAKEIWVTMDATDSLYVVDSTNNTASWYNVNPATSHYIQTQWLARRAA